jgi:flavodoxin
MLVWVVYESRLGNTAALAQAIGGALVREHRVRLLPVEEAGPPRGVDLLIIGCPHHRHHQPDGLLSWLFKLPPQMVQNLHFGVFEIRYKRHYFWQGESAAGLVWRRLHGGQSQSPLHSRRRSYLELISRTGAGKTRK